MSRSKGVLKGVTSMCMVCAKAALPRRAFLAMAAVAGAGAGLGLGAPRAYAAHGPKTDVTAAQAIEKLKQGNARFVANAEVCASELTRRRQEVAAGQTPWATIVSCSDSRVPPE